MQALFTTVVNLILLLEVRLSQDPIPVVATRIRNDSVLPATTAIASVPRYITTTNVEFGNAYYIFVPSKLDNTAAYPMTYVNLTGRTATSIPPLTAAAIVTAGQATQGSKIILAVDIGTTTSIVTYQIGYTTTSTFTASVLASYDASAGTGSLQTVSQLMPVWGSNYVLLLALNKRLIFWDSTNPGTFSNAANYHEAVNKINSFCLVNKNQTAVIVGEDNSIVFLNLGSPLSKVTNPVSYVSNLVVADNKNEAQFYGCIKIPQANSATAIYYLNVYVASPVFFAQYDKSILLDSQMTNALNAGSMMYLLFTTMISPSKVFALVKGTSQILTLDITITLLPYSLVGPIQLVNSSSEFGFDNYIGGVIQDGTTYKSMILQIGPYFAPPPPPIPVVYSPTLRLVDSFWVGSQAKVVLLFDLPVNYINFSNLACSIIDSLGQKFTSFSIKAVKTAASSQNQVEVMFEFRKTLFVGKITITHLDPTVAMFNSSTIYLDPTKVVTISNVTRAQDWYQERLDMSVYTISVAYKSTAYILVGFLTSLHPQSGLTLLRVINYFFLLRFISGESIFYPELILNSMSDTNFVASIRNLMTLSDVCLSYYDFYTRDFSCNIFNSFGQELLMICCVLLVTTVISVVNYLVKLYADVKNAVIAEKLKSKAVYKIVDNLYELFGYTLFFGLMEASLHKLGLSLVLGMANIGTSPNRIGSWILSLFFLGYYAIYALACLVHAARFLKKREQVREFLRKKYLMQKAEPNQVLPLPQSALINISDAGSSTSRTAKSHHSAAEKEPKSVEDIMQEHTDHQSLVSLAFTQSDFKKNRNGFFYGLPTILVGKDFLMVVAVYALTGQTVVLPAVLLGLEIFYFMVLVSGRLRKNWWNWTYEATLSLLFSGYISLKLVVATLQPQIETKQYILGGVMAGILHLIVVISFLYALINFAYHFTIFSAKAFGLRDPKKLLARPVDYGGENSREVYAKQIKEYKIAIGELPPDPVPEDKDNSKLGLTNMNADAILVELNSSKRRSSSSSGSSSSSSSTSRSSRSRSSASSDESQRTRKKSVTDKTKEKKDEAYEKEKKNSKKEKKELVEVEERRKKKKQKAKDGEAPPEEKAKKSARKEKSKDEVEEIKIKSSRSKKRKHKEESKSKEKKKKSKKEDKKSKKRKRERISSSSEREEPPAPPPVPESPQDARSRVAALLNNRKPPASRLEDSEFTDKDAGRDVYQPRDDDWEVPTSVQKQRTAKRKRIGDSDTFEEDSLDTPNPRKNNKYSSSYFGQQSQAQQEGMGLRGMRIGIMKKSVKKPE